MAAQPKLAGLLWAVKSAPDPQHIKVTQDLIRVGQLAWCASGPSASSVQTPKCVPFRVIPPVRGCPYAGESGDCGCGRDSRIKRTRCAPIAREKPKSDWKRNLQIFGAGRKSGKHSHRSSWARNQMGNVR